MMAIFYFIFNTFFYIYKQVLKDKTNLLLTFIIKINEAIKATSAV